MRAAREILARGTAARLGELEVAMRAAATGGLDARERLALEQVVTRVSVDLDAAAELLELSERALHTVEVELSIAELADASVRNGASRRRTDRETRVRFVVGDVVSASCVATPTS